MESALRNGLAVEVGRNKERMGRDGREWCRGYINVVARVNACRKEMGAWLSA